MREGDKGGRERNIGIIGGGDWGEVGVGWEEEGWPGPGKSWMTAPIWVKATTDDPQH